MRREESSPAQREHVTDLSQTNNNSHDSHYENYFVRGLAERSSIEWGSLKQYDPRLTQQEDCSAFPYGYAIIPAHLHHVCQSSSQEYKRRISPASSVKAPQLKHWPLQRKLEVLHLLVLLKSWEQLL